MVGVHVVCLCRHGLADLGVRESGKGRKHPGWNTLAMIGLIGLVGFFVAAFHDYGRGCHEVKRVSHAGFSTSGGGRLNGSVYWLVSGRGAGVGAYARREPGELVDETSSRAE